MSCPSCFSRSALVAWVAIALIAGCGDTFPTAEGDDVAAVNDVASDLGTVDAGEADTLAGDATPEDTTLADSAVADGGDTGGADAGPVCPGAPSCACKEDKDCDSGACVLDGEGNKACAKACKSDDDCGDDVCQDVAGVDVCVPAGAALCAPCVSNNACTYGDNKGACVASSGAGSFCGTDCSADTDCDKGYSCKDAKDIEGNDVKQCVPEADAVCSCTGYGLAKQAKTTCFAAGLPGCTATRQCLADGEAGAPTGGGLTECTPQTPTDETCDGVDNDCDGQTDEDGAASCDDKNGCTADTCQGGKGCENKKLDGDSCDDGDACTKGDTCAVGLCTGATVACDDNNPCTNNACDMATGCTTTNNSDKCDDGSACTKDDTCAAGLCAGVTVDCDDSNPCTNDSCDLASGCTTTNNSDVCDDATACTKDDTCAAGLCAGVTVDCDDSNPCTTDSCDAKTGCVNKTLDGDACDDGSACTTKDVCNQGKCEGGKLDCDDSNPCTDDACDMTSGCTSTDNSDKCDDSSACSDNDVCAGGKCGGTPKSCEDGNACTDDSCDPKTGCKFVQNTKPCDDGAACTVKDTCNAGKCGGAAKKCDDGNACTADTCDKASGNCLFKPLVGNTCDDGNACTTKDACDKDGKCAGGAQVVCEDNNQCTDDPCDPSKGCADKVLTKKPCDDGSVCTKADTCDGQGKCVGTALTCDDGNPCTDDSCDKVKGCQKANNTAKCDDGDSCTQDDVCSAGACKPGANSCQCKTDGDCVDSSTNKCNGALVCKSNKCVVNPASVVTCKSDNNACTADACNPATGKCDYAAVKDGTPCDADGSKCTDSDACAAGTCKAGKALNCDDTNDCTADACDKVKGCSNTNITSGGVTLLTFDTYPGKDGKLGTSDDLKVNKDDGVADQFQALGVSFKLVGGGVPRIHVSSSIVKPYAPNTLRPVDPKAEVKAENYKDIELLLSKPAMRVKVMVLDVHTNEASAVKAYNAKGDLIGEAKHPGAAGGNIIALEVKVDGSKGWIARVVVDLTQSTGSAAGPELYDNFEFEWAPTCEDGNICTAPDICASGKCGTGPVKTCDDGNQCTKDSCDAKTGCKNEALDKVPCEDGDKCTDGDACTTGKCVSGKAKSCDDGKPCTKDACDPKTGCTNTAMKDGDVCEDGSKCTGKDTCKAGKCLPGANVVCNDGDICTLDSCDPKLGCKATPIVGCGTKPMPLPYVEPFACGSGSSKLWQLAGAQKSPAWAVDGTPTSVAPFSPKCTLNFNNGTNYTCATGTTKLSGTATSPALDLTKAKVPVLTFQLNGDWEANNYDELYVEVSVDGGKTFKTVLDLNDNGSIKWVKKSYDLSPYVGKTAHVRFRFLTSDCFGNATVGPFIDDVVVEDTACTSNADCSDGNGCTVDTCSASTGKCAYASVKDGTKCDDGNLCTVSACNKGTCAVSSVVKCIDDGNACTVGEVCAPKTGKCAPTYVETCNDNNPCTSDTCNKTTAGCTHQSLKVCAPKCSAVGDCYDSNPCTVDSCGKGGVCAWTPAKVGTVCGDGKVCNKTGQCDAITGGWARQISSDAYGYHYCAATADGKVACWGRNNYYQSGYALSTASRTTPYVVPGVTKVKAVETGRYHSCALTSIGEVYCWGRNNLRQAAPSSAASTVSLATKVAGLLGVRSIAAGYDYTCALLSDRRVSCWGGNSYGLQGRGNTSSVTKPTLVPNLTGVLSLSGDYYHLCAVRSDGGLWCAGMNFDYQTHETSGQKTVFTKRGGAKIPTLDTVAAGYQTTCAGSGTGWACVGNSIYGAMGNGSTTDAVSPVPVTANGGAVADIGTGYYAHFALTPGGDIWGAGYDSYGSFGLASTVTTRSKYVMTGFGKSVDVDGGYRSTCALSTSGAVFCAGYNSYGGLGNGSTTSSNVPVAAKGPCTSVAQCNDGDPCTTDACTNGSCAWKASSGAKCDDGDACTTADICSAGKCAGKPAICDDKNACTQGDKCAVQNGNPVCVPGVAKKCDDGDKCTADSCDKGTGACVFKPIAGCTIPCKVDVDCDDKNSCTLNTCVKGTCQKAVTNNGKLCGDAMSCSNGACSGTGKGWAKRIASNTYASHACAVGTDTKLYCWGAGGDYRTGQSSTATLTKPKAVPGLSGVTDVEVGYSHTCAKASGKWWCFGDNFYGALGTGLTGSDTSKPQEVKAAANVVDMALGYRFSCALLANGKVNCFGYGSSGRLGNGTTSNSAKAVEVKGVAGATAVWAGYDHACARLADGTAKCWGANGEYAISSSSSSTLSTPVVKAGAKDIQRIAGYYSGTCWTTLAGKAYCTGDNDNGQLGSKSPTDQSAPLELVGPSDVFHVEGGGNHVVALSSTGKVWTAGYNSDGQLGVNSKTSSKTFVAPVITVLGQPVQVAAGYVFTCLLTDEGQVACTGNGSLGEQGDGSTADDVVFSAVAGPCVSGKSCNDNNPCTTDTCSSGACNFAPASGTACNDGVACTSKDVCASGVCKGTPVSCDDNNACTVGDACQEGKGGNPVCVPGKKTDCDDGNECTNDSCNTKTGACANVLIVGCVQGCKTDSDCNDNNLCTTNTCLSGKCATQSANDGMVCSEGKVCNSGQCAGSGKGWAAKISGAPYGRHYCALHVDGSAWCWGDGGDGRLGDGSTQSNVKPAKVSILKDLVDVYAFYRHSCAIDKAGKAWCWGNNSYGELGLGATGSDSTTPKAVSVVTDATKLAGGYYYTCALRKTGTVTCWGYGYNGRLGSGSTSSASVPKGVTVKGLTDVVDIQGFTDHACATKKDGTVWCWGENYDRQLFDTSTTRYYAPAQKLDAKGAMSVGGARDNVCWIGGKGTLWCTGDNDNGQLGNNGSADSGKPVAAPMKFVGLVAGGYDHQLALTADGKVWAVGDNDQGQLGNGNKTDSGAWLQSKLPAGTMAVQVDGTWDNTCVLTSAGQVHCVGDANYGQLGNGSTTDATSYSTVTGPCLNNGQCDDSDDCTQDVCGSGACTFTNLNAGTCSDGDACTTSDKCTAGKCVGKLVACDDKNGCTVGDKCEVQSNNAVCVPGKKKTCDDGNPCTADSCDVTTGACKYAPIKGCLIGCKKDEDCDNGDACTIDACNTVTGGCTQKQAKDGLICAEAGVCKSGKCGPVTTGWAKDIEADPQGRHICAQLHNNTMACWGNNSDGQIGNNSKTTATKPVLVAVVSDVKKMAVGDAHTCALNSQGKLWCWGYRYYGQLGDGSSSFVDQLTPKAATKVPPLANVWAGYRRTCGLDLNGKLWCWGYGGYGERGDKTTVTTQVNPVAVQGLPSDISRLDIRARRGCAQTKSGELWCWGYNTYRDVSPTSTTTISVATKRAAPAGVALFGGSYGTQCATVPAKSQLQCWGDNSDGQVGNGSSSFTAVSVPVAAKGLTVMPIAINGGDDHVVILGNNGKVFTAGDSGDLQGGNGTTTDKKGFSQATKFSGSYVKALGFYNTTCVLGTDGQVYCLGYNYYGGVGNGTSGFTDVGNPNKVPAPASPKAL